MHAPLRGKAALHLRRNAWLTNRCPSALPTAQATAQGQQQSVLRRRGQLQIGGSILLGSDACWADEVASATVPPVDSSPRPPTNDAGQTETPKAPESSPRPDSSSVTTPATPAPAAPPPSSSTPVPLDDVQLSEAAVNRLMQEEEEKRKLRRRKKGRIRELEEIRGELAEKELILLQKEQELLAKEESVMVLKEQLELERKLRALLSKEKEKAEEAAALAMGLCTGGAMLP